MYSVEFSVGAVEDLTALRTFEQRQILRAVEARLINEPTKPARSRKQLRGLLPPFEAVPPIWELRVGQYRVFYDVDEGEQTVYVRAIRHKPAHIQTEEIL